MKILVTGANGFIGSYLVPVLLSKGYNVITPGRAEMDITDPYALHDVFARYQPEVVVHAAAMSKPDECELNPSLAYSVNVEATVQLLLNAEEQKSFFIFLSTDFIFDGRKGMYSEEDDPSPVNYYGRTKLEAEEAVKEYPFDWCIIRTVLVYGRPPEAKSNLLTIVKHKLVNNEEYSVVDDQLRTPTYAGDLAAGIALVIEKKAKGVFHISGDEQMTPYQMASKTADHLGLNKDLLKKVTADTFKETAKRPLKTGFNIEKARRELGYEPISFEEGLKLVFGSDYM